MINFDLEQQRADYRFTIEEEGYRVSYLHLIHTLVFTNMDKGTGGAFKLDRPFSSKTPHESLVLNEMINHLDQLSETSSIWPTITPTPMEGE